MSLYIPSTSGAWFLHSPQLYYNWVLVTFYWKLYENDFHLQFDSDKPWITGPVTLTTDQGTSVPADLVFRCTGLKVNSVAYQSKLSDKMEKNGSLKVDRFLQVEEIENVFAIGDCNNTPELKLAYTAKLHAGKLDL